MSATRSSDARHDGPRAREAHEIGRSSDAGALSSAIAAQAVVLGIVRVLEKPMDGDDVLDLVEATMTSR